MKMKVMMVLMFLMGTGIVAQAQENNNEERQKMQVERVKKMAERKADDMKLEGDKKSDFVAMYLQYQNDLMNAHRKLMENRQKPQNPEEKKTLTDEEAKARVDKFFEQQEMQVQAAQARLAVHKKYHTAFAKTLTPQQLAEVFSEQRHPMQMGRPGQRPGRRGEWGRRAEMGDGPELPK